MFDKPQGASELPRAYVTACKCRWSFYAQKADNDYTALGRTFVTASMNTPSKTSLPLPFPTLRNPLGERRLDRLFKASGVIPTTSVAVAGPLAGVAMSALWRRGVERVEAARRVTSTHADETSQVLLIVGCASVSHIRETLDLVMPILASGGRLGVDASQIASVSERFNLCQLLAHRGLRYAVGMERRAEIIARKPNLMETFAIAS